MNTLFMLHPAICLAAMGTFVVAVSSVILMQRFLETALRESERTAAPRSDTLPLD